MRSAIALLLLGVSAVSSAQTTGPCQIQSNGLACTRKGYFEMTQCTSRDCFCVAANTGLPAEDTRTGNSRKLPTCSKCHFTLREIYSSAITLAPTAYIPTCDTKKGEYTEIQCHAARRECWCVDVATGVEISGTRAIHTNNQLMKCGPSTGGKNGRFPTALNGRKIEYPVGKESCKLSVDRGTSDGRATKIMYYFDIKHADCFAFEYLGKGGNDNRYATKHDCHSKCQLADMFSCSGLVESKGTCGIPNMPPPPPPPPAKSAGKSTPPPTTTTEKPQCPEGYRCQMGAFFGFCCNSEVEDFYQKQYTPVCPNGSQPHKDNTGDWDETRLGTNCSHNFCPSGKKCVQGDLFAFCC